jgi:hypothetical protein
MLKHGFFTFSSIAAERSSRCAIYQFFKRQSLKDLSDPKRPSIINKKDLFGSRKDATEARRLYERALEQGDDRAKFKLGRLSQNCRRVT